ncbi:hypothetical protein L1049_026657 [Liquidambar formosana]|uniref:Uncharacterized protein n=1 Tax=Liquidambar formosana TaxID=63359 RepID=A0AAP0NDS7_LIQFO
MQYACAISSSANKSTFTNCAFSGAWYLVHQGAELWVHTPYDVARSGLYNTWCEEHGKTYSSQEEKQYRLRVFEDNLAFVTQHNAAGNNSSYTLSLNGFADLTHHEFKASRLGLSAAAAADTIDFDRRRPLLELDDVGEIPSSVDWRKDGAVTHVKDQGSCGACWSFSATGAIEGINKIVTGSLVSLSEQELVDCDRSYNSGCGGGLMDYAYQFIIDNQGIDTEDDYPYQAGERSCQKDKLKRHVVTIDGYTDVSPNNEKRLLQAVAVQPVSVGICGSERAFQLYSKGIFTGPCSTSLDHAVLIVGYGSENGVDYWIVKNSWGTRWGMDGYIHMLRNSANSQGVCGINMLASYPTKTSPNPPPPPSPAPTICDLFTSCSEGETCCCTLRFVGVCFSWKCCELDSAVCCKDHRYCCPHDYPVCDTKRKQCLKHTGNVTRVKELEKRGSLAKFGSWSSIFEAWNL